MNKIGYSKNKIRDTKFMSTQIRCMNAIYSHAGSHSLPFMKYMDANAAASSSFSCFDQCTLLFDTDPGP